MSMTTPRVTVPVEPTEAMINHAVGHIGGGSTFDTDDRREIAQSVWSAMLSAAPAPEGGAVQWSHDLTSVPKGEPFLIAYADGDVRMGHYLDNSKSSVPWEGIRPLFGAERWDAKIIAWAKRPDQTTTNATCR